MKKFVVLSLIILIALGATAQQKKVISGKVTDDSGQPLPGAKVSVSGLPTYALTDEAGLFMIVLKTDSTVLTASCIGYQSLAKPVSVHDKHVVLQLKQQAHALQETVVVGYQVQRKVSVTASVATVSHQARGRAEKRQRNISAAPMLARDDFNTNDYSPIQENIFHQVKNKPLSTFSSDVDRASYTQIRQMLNSGQLPPADAVRVEEMINYFDYEYATPQNTDPVAIHSTLSVCPWNSTHMLARIGLQGKKVPVNDLPASNIVFLIDVSGSMEAPNKLPLVKQAFKALVQQLRPQDRVAIVVYAGAAGAVLPSVSASEKDRINTAINNLSAGGSTAGGAGIKLAYSIAQEHFIPKGNNRVIIASDGDFNVGESSDAAMQRLIEQEREKGIFLSVLGFGMGNYKDNKMETLANKGNGNYAYIDNFEEARRTFVTEFGGTLFTIAKDVKLQVEFNPKFVQAYRLVGYENRLLNDEDFNDDKKDAGDMGSGHTVTALYEIVPTSIVMKDGGNVDPLKYQVTKAPGNDASEKEMFTVKMRYKEPDGNKSKLVEKVQYANATTTEYANESFRLAAAVAEFGMLLRNSQFKGTANYDRVLEMAAGAKGADTEGYRAEFIQLVKKAKLLQQEVAVK